MMLHDINSPSFSRWPKRTGHVIDIMCFCALLLVMGIVIYGLLLRAVYERSYYGAVGLAGIGALVMLIGLAQQTIAARDAATWRKMAEWQIKSARTKAMQMTGRGNDSAADLDRDSSLYYEHLVEALIIDIQEPTLGTEHDDR